MTTTTKHEAFSCPSCGATLDASTPVEDGGPPPQEGDISICGYCACVLGFDGEGPEARPRRLTEVEIENIDAEDRAQIAQAQGLILATRTGRTEWR